MSDSIKALVTERQLRSIMIVKELQIQMFNDPPYLYLFLVLTLGVTIDILFLTLLGRTRNRDAIDFAIAILDIWV